MITQNLRAQYILKYMLLSTTTTILKIKFHKTIEKNKFHHVENIFLINTRLKRCQQILCFSVMISSHYHMNILAKRRYKIQTRYGWRQLGPIHFMDRNYVL